MSEELVEKVARELWCQFLDEVPEHWSENGPHGPDSILAARASIGVVLDAVREVVESERLEETEDPFATNLSVTGRAADRAYNRALDDVLSGLSIDSLGAEGGNPE